MASRCLYACQDMPLLLLWHALTCHPGGAGLPVRLLEGQVCLILPEGGANHIQIQNWWKPSGRIGRGGKKITTYINNNIFYVLLYKILFIIVLEKLSRNYMKLDEISKKWYFLLLRVVFENYVWSVYFWDFPSWKIPFWVRLSILALKTHTHVVAVHTIRYDSAFFRFF